MGNCFIKKKQRNFTESIFKPHIQSQIKIYKTAPEPMEGCQPTNYIANATKEVRRLYNVKRTLLGAGAFGKVYLAESREDPNIKFAIKIMHLKLLPPQLAKQLRSELTILQKLDHPYICNYIESFEDDKYIYIVMEYCQGMDLQKRLDEEGTFNEFQTASVIYKVLEGLNHIHNVNVVHRDLKPENIIVDGLDNPKIIDFGLSSDTLNGTKRLKTYLGSKCYMAPEMIENIGHTSTVDMWSIGIILFQMISNSFPFNTKNIEYEISNSPVVFIGKCWDHVSLLCKHFIL
jgi:serine/threonine protein kinase